jgi:hypothetical protein
MSCMGKFEINFLDLNQSYLIKIKMPGLYCVVWLLNKRTFRYVSSARVCVEL